jgi:GT2 family glycosyltransferase
MAKLVVVIISWNTRDLTRNCLQTLFPELEGMDNEVWVVDNASTDDSVEMIKKEFPSIKLILNRENVGFARANNQVLREVSGEYYLLLNTDTLIPPNSIKTLVDYLDKNQDVGAVGPQLKNAAGVVERPLKPLPTLSGELRYCLATHFFPFNGLFRILFSRRRTDWKKIDEPTPAEVLSAACLLIRKAVIDKIGLLAEDYFLFSEENDYFYRMRQAGFRGFYLPGVEIVHLIGMSRKKRGRTDSEVNFFRSRMHFFDKFHHQTIFMFKSIYAIFFGWSYLIAGAVRIIKTGQDSEDLTVYKALLKTLWNGGRV